MGLVCGVLELVPTDTRGRRYMSQGREKTARGLHKDEVKGQDVFRGQVVQLYGERQEWCPIGTLEFGLELKVGGPT